MLLLGIAFGIIGVFFVGIGICMSNLHKNMAATYVKEQRARLPKDNEKEKHEPVKFLHQVQYITEEQDLHYSAIRPYFPDRTVKKKRNQDDKQDDSMDSEGEDFQYDEEI